MMNEELQIREVCNRFQLQGEYRNYEVINSGHINTTYKVYFFRDGEIKDYILQRVNTYVFKEPVEMMDNISSVTEYVRAKIKATGISAKRYVLHYSTTVDGDYYTFLPDGGFWRCCRFIDDSMSFLKPESSKIVEESGKAFGEFEAYLADYPVQKLNIVIPHFHNTVKRYETFKEAIVNNFAGRAKSVDAEIREYLDLEEMATRLYRMQKLGQLPLRVTHNDTKTSNVLFDAATGEHLSVIDLDTVMPGLVAHDFGDAIRVAASTGEEDEKNLEKVALDMEKYEAFTRGFVGTVGSLLTEEEKKTLSLGAVAMTVECGMRFLTDYLDGDKYFKIHYPDQNLVRARCHLVLAKDMIKRLDEMQHIVEKYL
ncbi:MAG: aminoglycoside phosphotransferase family protein [Clostridia bacterium]|nr:aminoglycoside phosphotransferase family protein [Clostridia bacterium]